MPQRKWNNIPDLLRTMSVKVSVKDGKISNQTTVGRGWRYLVRLGLSMRRMTLALDMRCEDE